MSRIRLLIRDNLLYLPLHSLGNLEDCLQVHTRDYHRLCRGEQIVGINTAMAPRLQMVTKKTLNK